MFNLPDLTADSLKQLEAFKNGFHVAYDKNKLWDTIPNLIEMPWQYEKQKGNGVDVQQAAALALAKCAYVQAHIDMVLESQDEYNFAFFKAKHAARMIAQTANRVGGEFEDWMTANYRP